jgi:diamine N-acetyltransferase
MISKLSVITLQEISQATLLSILRLDVSDRQKNYVASNAKSIAEAYFEPKAWFRAIYADETPVGFLMLYDDPEKAEYFLWRFMIDVNYQKLGFAKRALELLIQHVKTKPNAIKLGVSCVPDGEESPCPFYIKMGFVPTGEVDDGEVVMSLAL